jgi:CDP-diacylglycerol pyrophosphatase
MAPQPSAPDCAKRLTAFRASAALVVIGFAVFLLAAIASAAQGNRSRDALWQIVDNLCIPGQTQNHDPRPCAEVDLSGGVEKGFAILKDLRGATQFLLIPTARISGIESPVILQADAPNYFAEAWDARTFIDGVLHRSLPRDDVGLAINSAVSRSQDELHIHIDCVRADVADALHKDRDQIGSTWAPLNRGFLNHSYLAMWVRGEHLGSNSPFRLLADGVPGAATDMGNRTLVVVGLTRSDGTVGFVILADRVNVPTGDLASGEELLDHSCRIASAQ